MPELPEVETVRRTLKQLVIGKTVERVSVLLPRIIQHPDDIEAFQMLLCGETIRSVERRGKFLRFIFDHYTLVSHLRMEGRYGLYGGEEPMELHTHVVFHFTDGTELRYKDVRQFGTMHLYPKDQDLLEAPLKKLGLEPLDDGFTFEAFRERIGKRSTKIKPLLLNQEYIVGLGNIYVDESLFLAGIHPEREAHSLSKQELAKLYEAVVTTLKSAVAVGGSTIKSYVNGQGEIGMFQHQFKMYGRKAEPCFQCGHSIEKTVVAGRGTHYCPKCQPLKRKRIQ
ncbi:MULTISPECIES: DNA-formamidopyrimidine glycosylase [unclassified Paenibacillus]|uniref:DNA-formamidopyrimidine glycosylase n=1 Tax=unclassified Paenibacillus TaxID=185978 RepID=UPI001AE8700D|nr:MULTISPECIES: DNA-formamidopyrimidine glycosylase [unclassified Paenibacillus]MBP1154629.1 formamidopyrimidine-DNA glycosylase [Paenibacillus sp. PvP091]MBP1169987.1 formamidopyrimidine-DNA glycosylase [Paenibacillus sp. PvR098]MBP2441015.1 formamidopyrimidine-DNA glycosylase [Paenibacillus sp. PvP052]